MTEAEKLIDRQLADTMHARRGGAFNRFNGRRVPLARNSKIDETGLYKLDYPAKKNK